MPSVPLPSPAEMNPEQLSVYSRIVAMLANEAPYAVHYGVADAGMAIFP